MLEVNGLNIEATPAQILEDLKYQCEKNGVHYFRSIKPGNDNIQFSCPFHSEGQEKHPSAGMTTVKMTRMNGKVVPAGTVHCFTCGYSAELAEFVSNVFGRMDGGFYGNQWLKKNYTTALVVTREPLKLDMGRGGKEQARPVHKSYISEAELDSYRYYHEYMWKRGLTKDIVELFDIGYDEKRKCLTFPVHDAEGRVPFIQTRSVGTKFHHYERDVVKTNYLYGEYEGRNEYPDAQQWLVTESVLNALTWWIHMTPKTGIPAVALMGVGGGEQYRLLEQLPGRTLILGLDPDKAGEVASEKIFRLLRRKKVIKRLEYPDWMYEQKKDINDLQEGVQDLSIKMFEKNAKF